MRIEVKDVSKRYGKKTALKHVTFTLEGPKIYGLLGRNGAGKTTFMDILAGHRLATSGEITIDGKKPFDKREILKNICLIKEADNFHENMRIKHIYKSYAYFYPNWDQPLADRLTEMYGLNKNARFKTLSKGMASAVGIIVGLASKAPITIFDEPYIGLDANARKQFYDILVEEYEKEKRMIIFSTHLIDEVSLLFEEILILKEGELILQEDADQLRSKSFSVTGSVDEVEKFIANKQVINKKKLANMMTAYVYGSPDEAAERKLRVEGMPIQDLIIYLTETEKEAN